jgi:hypothetical protein
MGADMLDLARQLALAADVSLLAWSLGRAYSTRPRDGTLKTSVPQSECQPNCSRPDRSDVSGGSGTPLKPGRPANGR